MGHCLKLILDASAYDTVRPSNLFSMNLHLPPSILNVLKCKKNNKLGYILRWHQAVVEH